MENIPEKFQHILHNHGWVLLLLLIPSVLYALVQLSISYTYGCVVATLAQIEDTSPAAVIIPGEDDVVLPPYTDNAEDADAAAAAAAAASPSKKLDQIEFITPSPLTSSFKRTLSHLKSRGGRWSPYRGASVALVIFSGTRWICRLISSVTGAHPVVFALAFILTQLVFARLNLLWTHIVISEPSSKYWWRRLPSRSATKKILLPTLVWAFVQTLLVTAPAAMFQFLMWTDFVALSVAEGDEKPHPAVVGGKAVAILLFSFILMAGVWFPMQVAFVRAQAALLSEDETPIVPFDRTFGGRVVSVAEGGTGRLRLKDAWKSLDKPSRRRVGMVYVKTFGLQVAAMFGFVLTVMLICSPIIATTIKNKYGNKHD